MFFNVAILWSQVCTYWLEYLAQSMQFCLLILIKISMAPYFGSKYANTYWNIWRQVWNSIYINSNSDFNGAILWS